MADVPYGDHTSSPFALKPNLAIRYRQQRLAGSGAASAPTAGYPKVYNIEMGPFEQLNVGGLYIWVVYPILETIGKYERTLKDYPNPPAANVRSSGAPGKPCISGGAKVKLG